MKTLTERLNMSINFVSDAYKIKSGVNSINAFDTLCLICSELNEGITFVSDADFSFAAESLGSFFVNHDHNDIYVWFDAK